MGGVAKEYITKLGCEIYFHTEHRWRCSNYCDNSIMWCDELLNCDHETALNMD
jgi:hypothetical protein